jgi:hypothetical protein
MLRRRTPPGQAALQAKPTSRAREAMRAREVRADALRAVVLEE